MKQKNIPIFLVILALSVASLACQAATGLAKPTEAIRSTEATIATQVIEVTSTPKPTETPAQTSILPAFMTSTGTGWLCVGTQTGLNCLDENGWQVYTEENSNLPSNYLYAGAVCPDGSLVIAHSRGISLFDGKTWKQIPGTDAFSSVESIACEANNGIWVAHFRGVSYYAKGQWITYGSQELGSGDSASELVYAVEVAPDGKVWVLTSRSVAMFSDGTWTIYQEGQGFQESRFFNALTVDARGRPWAAHSSGVDVFENGTWQLIKKTDFNSPTSIAVDAKGQIWLGTLSAGALMFDNYAWVQHDRSSESLSSNHVAALAADSSGRVWLGTTYGLTVFDGTNWRTFLMGNSDLGDNDVKFILVTNDGPTLPVPAEKEKASLTGKLRNADQNPLVDMRVEICVEIVVSTYNGATPCSDQPFFLSTKTDKNGVFLFENIPAGYYVVVAETGSSWAQLTDQFGISSERTLIQAGEKFDIETLTLEK